MFIYIVSLLIFLGCLKPLRKVYTCVSLLVKSPTDKLCFMRISLGSRIKIEHMNTGNGYGYATDRILGSLAHLGHEVNVNDPTAPVQIWFDQPHHWEWNKNNQYKIGYHPWESTELKKGWLEKLNECDEVWTPSAVVAKWYAEAGVVKPIYVFEHGVDDIWFPRDEDHAKIRYLHVGAEAARKGGWDTMRAFRSAFTQNNDVEFTLKTLGFPWKLDRIGKTNIINRPIPVGDLVALFQEHDVYVYPSWGEGFGLTPLQAMACGKPTITVPDWAPYERFLHPALRLESTLAKSPWQEIHPGKMFKVNQDDLVDKLRWSYDNFEEIKEHAMSVVPKIKAEYNWISLTKEAFDGLEKRLESL